MIKQGDLIWTLMVSSFMQKYMDDDGTTRNDRDRIVNTQDLAQSALILALKSERDSVFDMEDTAMLIHINNMSLSDIVESQDTLVGDLNDRMVMFEEDRVVLKAAPIQL